MKLAYTTKEPVTLEQFCGQPPGSFEKFLRARERKDATAEVRALKRISKAQKKRKGATET